ncbi:hypothetical protein BGW38_008181 [Lunasporangiospora selenospora]|uniref:Uncharacterized protein n=1 Tax=Lunasporangiospora selenospora TaxID=979761 RepID=A0A9P6FJT6_9FUNG|nr:hypothetical protein BGW38_008181 [Lunasporangiospora selenospora]
MAGALDGCSLKTKVELNSLHSSSRHPTHLQLHPYPTHSNRPKLRQLSSSSNLSSLSQPSDEDYSGADHGSGEYDDDDNDDDDMNKSHDDRPGWFVEDTSIQFQKSPAEQDPAVGFFYTPRTLTILSAMLLMLVYVAMSPEVDDTVTNVKMWVLSAVFLVLIAD